MKSFNQLSTEGFEGSFTVEPNELTEIHVNYEGQTVTVETFQFSDHMKGNSTKEIKYAKPSFLGGKSLEQLFNESLNTL